MEVSYSECSSLETDDTRAASTECFESNGSSATNFCASVRAASIRRGFFSASMPMSETPHWLRP